MSLEVSYRGEPIGQLTQDGALTLCTAGRFCEGDISLCYTGGENPEAEEDDVLLIDYDGTIRYSYSEEAFLGLTALPPNPRHPGLIAQGWNWTLADAQAYVRKSGELVIGQMYTTLDGKTHGWMMLSENMLYVKIGFGLNGTAVVDFCDGSEPVTLTDNRLNRASFAAHRYASPGRKTFTITVTAGFATLMRDGNNRQLLCCAGQDAASPAVGSALTRLALGRNMGLGDNPYCLAGLSRLETLSMPRGAFGSAASSPAAASFYDCGLRAAVIPEGGGTAFSSADLRYTPLLYVSVPKQFKAGGNYFNQGAYNLRRFCLTNSDGVIGNYAFSGEKSLSRLYIPESVEEIKTYGCSSLSSLQKLSFAPASPPTASASTCFYELPTGCLLYVPAGSLAAYLTATNYPNPADYTYIGYAAYETDAALPAADPSGSYALTWYAAEKDAVARQNAITQGNGKRIYCRYTAA